MDHGGALRVDARRAVEKGQRRQRRMVGGRPGQLVVGRRGRGSSVGGSALDMAAALESGTDDRPDDDRTGPARPQWEARSARRRPADPPPAASLCTPDPGAVTAPVRPRRFAGRLRKSRLNMAQPRVLSPPLCCLSIWPTGVGTLPPTPDNGRRRGIMGRYAELHRRSIADPEGFWGEAAEAIDWTRRWDMGARRHRGTVLPLVRGRRAEHLPQCARPSCRRRQRRSPGADLRQPGGPGRREPIPTPS